MPDVDSEQLYKLFAAVYELPGPEKDCYLDEICNGQSELREQVEKLIARSDAGLAFLRTSQNDAASTEAPILRDGNDLAQIATVSTHRSDDSALETIDHYRIREKLGEGGMGEVYVAEQFQPVRRKVALKIIKPGMATKDVIARFESERQALAMMSHPNIAKVLDGGTTSDGRPYFVMELVRGIPITEFCDQQRFTTRQRLELFVKVCQAVQHAHLRGIIHRDLKPSNVMVEMRDGECVPKVIDFGIAKATNQRLVEQSIYTQMSQLIGTPLYMSPEQAEFSSLDIDTRSDIYSLGVLLYEILTGTTPFDASTLRSVGLDEMRRIIREDDPPRPSCKVITLDYETAVTVSTNRQSDPRELSLSMRRELDWIVMKALEKDRSRRYESTSEFVKDVERYLKDEPVEACPPTLVYRMTKYGKRHRGLLIATTLIVCSLLMGLTLAITQLNRAQRAEDLAKEESDRSVQMLYSMEMTNATKEYFRGNTRQVTQTLDRYSERALRTPIDYGYEWFLAQNFTEVVSQEIFKCPNRIRCFLLNRESGSIMIGDSEGMISLIDPQTGSLEVQFNSGHNEALELCNIDATVFVSCGKDGSVCVWRVQEVPDGIHVNLVSRLKVSELALPTVAYDHQRELIYTADNRGRIAAVDWKASKVINPMEFAEDVKIRSLVALETSEILAESFDGTIKLGTSLDSSVETLEQRGIASGYVKDFAELSSQGKIAWGRLGGQITVAERSAESKVDFRLLLPADLHSMGASEDGKWIVAGDAKGQLHLIPVEIHQSHGFLDSDFARERRTRSWKAHNSKVEGVAVEFDANGELQVISAGRDGRVIVSKPFQNSFYREVNNQFIYQCHFLDSGTILTAGNHIELRSANEEFELLNRWGQRGEWADLHLCRESGEVLLGKNERELFFTTQEGLPELILEREEPFWEARPNETANHIAISPSGEFLVIVAKIISPLSNYLQVYHLDPLKLVAQRVSRATNDIVFSPDSTQFAMVQDDNVVVCDSESGTELHTLVGHTDSVHDLDYSPDGNMLVSVSKDSRLICWDPNDGTKSWEVEAHANRANAVAFHPFLPTISTVGADAIVRFWSVFEQTDIPEDFRLVGEFPLQSGRATRMEFSPNGQKLMVQHGTGTLTFIESIAIPQAARQ
ncbi:WD40 repeat domain-containing serine/threonine-protein kinase [Thalassoglobus sp. JC818]|uniref:WD40 repeat domain-containing serine/threonine-protein kinase n=1 Tax=Thalassoglobus sp. JC818 TaxID=3232136 RepID=UPI00345A7513